MNNLIKIKTAQGDDIFVPAWQLVKQKMEEFASKHYGKQIICDPGLIYDGRIAVVWRCRYYLPTLEVAGYFYFHNEFRDYPVDFEYPVLVFAPFSHVTAEVGGAKVSFNDGKLAFLI